MLKLNHLLSAYFLDKKNLHECIAAFNWNEKKETLKPKYEKKN